MSTLVEATVSADDFVLGDSLASIPNAEFRMFRLVAHGRDRVMPFVLARYDDRTSLVDALTNDASVENATVLADFGDEWLIDVDWDARIGQIVSAIDDEDATILDAVGQDGRWSLQIMFRERESVSRVYDRWEVTGLDPAVDRICDVADASHDSDATLTKEQYQAISHAYEAGYYDVPRRVNQVELARTFDVSHQALSERLRRGHQAVIANLLYRDPQGPEPAVAP